MINLKYLEFSKHKLNQNFAVYLKITSTSIKTNEQAFEISSFVWCLSFVISFLSASYP